MDLGRDRLDESPYLRELGCQSEMVDALKGLTENLDVHGKAIQGAHRVMFAAVDSPEPEADCPLRDAGHVPWCEVALLMTYGNRVKLSGDAIMKEVMYSATRRSLRMMGACDFDCVEGE